MSLIVMENVSLGYGGAPVVNEVSLEIPAGPSGVGLVGESGSGKSTIARAIVGLLAPQKGRILYDGRDLAGFDRAAHRKLRREMQIVFQDSDGSLDPKMRVGESVAEVAWAHRLAPRKEVWSLVRQIFADVGLNPDFVDRFPYQLSGGQRQRVNLSRALILRPRLLMLDEPTSALDVVIQAQVLDLIEDLRERYSLSYLLISHSLAVVNRLCDYVYVLKDGSVVEEGISADVLHRPRHPYTQALREAVFEIPRFDDSELTQ